jgi:hypothetical protein
VSAITSDGNRVDWRLPLYTVLGALILFSAGPHDLSVVLYLLVVAIVSIFLLNEAIGKRRRQSLLALVIFWAVSAALVKNESAICNTGRWLVWAHHYKAVVLAEPESAKGEFKHIEWDGWGMFAQNTYVFLVYDPTDSLSLAAKGHQPGKIEGIPCEIDRVRRLESHWYSVQFYTGDYWGQQNADC